MLRRYLMLMVLLTTLPNGASAAEWGSIVYSPATGAVGYSNNWPDEVDAELSALGNCEEYADDCTTAVNFHDACGALAVGNGGGWGASWGTSRADAERASLRRCSQYDRGCEVRRWQCSR